MIWYLWKLFDIYENEMTRSSDNRASLHVKYRNFWVN